MGERQTVPALVQEAAAAIKKAHEREELRGEGLPMERRITDLVVQTVEDPNPDRHSRMVAHMKGGTPNLLRVDYLFESDGVPVAVRITGEYPRPVEDNGIYQYGGVGYRVDLIDPESVGTDKEISTGFRYSVNNMGIARMNDSRTIDHEVDLVEFALFDNLIGAMELSANYETLRVAVKSPLSALAITPMKV